MLKKCEFCGKEYETHNSKSKYCSISCSNKGRNHRNVKCNCDVCGKSIEVIYSRYKKNKHNYCSSECQSKGKTLFYTGGNNPLYRKSKVKCEICGKEIEINDYKLSNQKHFCCSKECKYKLYKEIFKGKNNPSYKELSEEERFIRSNKREIALIGYKRWRKDVFERDNYTCRCCRRKTHKNNAHHLNSFDWDKEHRLDVDNGITLCEECHVKFHMTYGYGKNTLEQFKEFINIIKGA